MSCPGLCLKSEVFALRSVDLRVSREHHLVRKFLYFRCDESHRELPFSLEVGLGSSTTSTLDASRVSALL